MSMIALFAVSVTAGLCYLANRISGLLASCKWLLSYLCVEARRRRVGRRFDLYDLNCDHDPTKIGFLPPQRELQLEAPRPEAKGVDEVFAYGVNSRGDCLVARVAHTTDSEAEAWLHLRLDGRVFRVPRRAADRRATCDPRTFSCGDLQMHSVSPMRVWRIFYNGMLRETSERDSHVDRMVHVKLAILWRASSDEFDFLSDVKSSSLATGLAGAQWKTPIPPIDELSDALDMYAQGGTLAGTVSIDDHAEEHQLYLFGERIRFMGDLPDGRGMKIRHVLGHMSKYGSILHLAEASVENVVENLKFGFMVQSSGSVHPLTELTLDRDSEESDVKTSFQADGLSFELRGQRVGAPDAEGGLKLSRLRLRMNGMEGSGLLIEGRVEKNRKRRIEERSSSNAIPSGNPLVVPFSSDACRLPEWTGGKGSSLATLSRLSGDVGTFVVPDGWVVTTAAYKLFVTEVLLQKVKDLEDVVYGKTEGDVKEYCERVSEEVIRSNLPDAVLQAVVQCLQKTFGDRMNFLKFAVRSSATGEDTDQLSAAGQMETFLGVCGLSEILSAVKKCWASQFGFSAIQYKWQNGQVLNSPMAVVLQEMVPCDVAGVLFTCNPLTGNPGTLSITANYGLGESVVSGSQEPDTLELQRDADDQLTLKNRVIGAKRQRILLGERGTTSVDVSDAERESCCLSEEKALRLGTLAIQIEKHCRSRRDIEWGFWNNNLYIFQSRPVTSGSAFTEYEIDHEFDDPMRTENDFFTVCNVGEVMPGALSPLGLDVAMKFFTFAFQKETLTDWQHHLRPNYYPKGMLKMYYHVMFYTADLFENFLAPGRAAEAGQIALFGRIVEDEELRATAAERAGRNRKESSLLKTAKLVLVCLIAEGHLRSSRRFCSSYSIPRKETAQELYDRLLYSCSDLAQAMNAHMLCSSMSSIFNMIVLSMVQSPDGGVTEAAYNDFSKLLACISGVESADVPAAVQGLAYSIAQDIDAETFKKMDLEECERWLTSTQSPSGRKFREFLEKHGHRCLKEFDMYSIPWGADPKILVRLMQNLVGIVDRDTATKQIVDFDQLLSELHVSLGFRTKFFLKKVMLPLCRKFVQNREASKSAVVRGLDAWRKGYRLLARLMVNEGRIPDPDLLFFMTLPEIGELLRHRSPHILARANHRRRRHPELDGYIFPEMMSGFPRPVNRSRLDPSPAEDGFAMRGIPVSQGLAKGFLRVAPSLEEAAHLKAGEILLAYSTDIGWSPYFPFLAGVATELGGLISHGAVVSREYGLPCVVGLHGATGQFRTGDYVLLDGNRGILQKLPPPEMSTT